MTRAPSADCGAAFFGELDVLDGRLVLAEPRSEYAAEVATLLESVRSLDQKQPRRIRGYSHTTLHVPPVSLPVMAPRFDSRWLDRGSPYKNRAALVRAGAIDPAVGAGPR